MLILPLEGNGGAVMKNLTLVPQERRPALLRNLNSLNIECLTVESCTQARRLLSTCPEIDVVITDVSLPDGNWCDVFRSVVDSGIPAGVVVSAASADEKLWSEVLWRGAYDLLVEPLDAAQVQHTIEGAIRSVSDQRLARSGPMALAAAHYH